jgi:hypothetical protein
MVPSMFFLLLHLWCHFRQCFGSASVSSGCSQKSHCGRESGEDFNADPDPDSSKPGVYISVRKRYLFPSPLPPLKMIFFSPLATHCYDSHHGLFALILPYFAFIFVTFPFRFSLFLSPFFLFLLHFPHFSLRLFIFFSLNDIG